VFSSPKGRGRDTAARTGSDFSVIFAGQGRSNGLIALTIAIGMPALPHPAANRLVQSAFLIGFAMRKALSISQSTRYNVLICHEIRHFSGIFRLVS
jgi:hypothetical protein